METQFNNESAEGGTLSHATKPRQRLVATEPNVFSYLDYRVFLKEWLEWKKTQRQTFSAAQFCRRAGLSSHNLLGLIIRGQRNLGLNSIFPFAHSIGLKKRASQYFENLVQFNQAKNDKQRNEYFDRLSHLAHESKGISDVAIKKVEDYSDYLSDWRNLALRELVNLHDFNADSVWISQKLMGVLKPTEVNHAWELLLRLGLVTKSAAGEWIQTEPVLHFDPQMTNFIVRRYHRGFLEHSLETLDKGAFEDRKNHSLVISISQNQKEEFEKDLEVFYRMINEKYSSKKGTATAVWALNSQLLKLTQTQETKSGKGPAGGDL